ncbi:MAG: hypothetical protein M1826_007648 [Phylliscum demangeonii]|nr:MAG: hypothetical protein M1826_007648 [Phylliscum demangeonii]
MPAKSRCPPTHPSTGRPDSGSSGALSSRDPLGALHDAELDLILEYLNPEDIVRAGAVSRQWQAYFDSYIATTAMRRSFPHVWDQLRHGLPQNQLELVREYRRQARDDYALRTGKATACRRYSKAVLYSIRAPYVAWSAGTLQFHVENLFSAKAAWQGGNALDRSFRTTPVVDKTRIEYLILATTLDLLFLRMMPYSRDATFRVEVGRRLYLSDIARRNSELELVVEDLATGAHLYRRLVPDVGLCSLHVLATQDLIALSQPLRVTILAGDTGDVIRAVDVVGGLFWIEDVVGSNNLVFRYHNNMPLQHHDLYHFYHLRHHPAEGAHDSSDATAGGGARYRLDELRRTHVCRVSNAAPKDGFFQRNMRDHLCLAAEPSTVADREQWTIRLMREEAAGTVCACVEQRTGTLDFDRDGLYGTLVALEAGMPPPRGAGSHYRTEQSALVTLPPESAEPHTKDGRRPRRPFESDADPQQALRWDSVHDHYIVFTSALFDLCILSFRPEG